MRPVVFLDIDGVLRPFGSDVGLDAGCLEGVRSLSGVADIVLSSSWPVYKAREAGIPISGALEDHERRGSEFRRLEGISRWLSDHPGVPNWVSVDDDPEASVAQRLGLSLFLGDPRRLVRCDWVDVGEGVRGSGLTMEKVARILSFFSGRGYPP